MKVAEIPDEYIKSVRLPTFVELWKDSPSKIKMLLSGLRAYSQFWYMMGYLRGLETANKYKQ